MAKVRKPKGWLTDWRPSEWDGYIARLELDAAGYLLIEELIKNPPRPSERLKAAFRK